MVVAQIGASKAATTDISSSAGQQAVSSGSTNTKGSYAQLIASTPIDCYGFVVSFQTSSSADHLVDIAIGGAGVEQIILPNMVMCRQIGNTRRAAYAYIPMGTIPAGSRIAARVQSSIASGNVLIALTLLPANNILASALLGRATNYGANTGTSGGVSVDPGGSANTKGSYAQLTSSTTNPLKWLVLMIGNQANATRGSAQSEGYTVDLAIGAAASEQIVIPDITLGAASVESCIVPILISLPFTIPAGTRIACRGQSTIIDPTDRKFDVSLIGID